MEKTLNHIDAMLNMQTRLTLAINLYQKGTHHNSLPFEIIPIHIIGTLCQTQYQSELD